MANLLLAVLVPHSATVDTVTEHLAAPLLPLLSAHAIDGYRLGGGWTGAWDPDYDPTLDPRNWRTCTTCNGTTQADGRRCMDCFPDAAAGRKVGTVLEWNAARWVPHPGDIVALPRLLDPGWRYPTGRTPDAWADLAGIVWLATDADLTRIDTGQTPSRLRQVFDDLHTGRRNPQSAGTEAQQFDPARWAVAVVGAHY